MTTALLLSAAFFVLAEIADCVTTSIALKRGKIEGNRITRFFFGKHVVVGSAAISAVYVAFCLWGGQYDPRGAQVGLWLVGIAHVVAAIANARAIGS